MQTENSLRVGVDEVGRGPIAGPVMVCVFGSKLADDELLALFPKGIMRDSKKLSGKRREEVFEKLCDLEREGRVFWHTTARSAVEIDKNGIISSIKACVEESMSALCDKKKISPKNVQVLLDGSLRAPPEYQNQETIIKGDEKILVIACASIVAKVTRDSFMKKMDKKYPEYGFEKHVGYGTSLHYEKLETLGKTVLHRNSFLKSKKHGK